MTDTTSSDYPCNCRSCGTIISPSVTDMCEECEIAVERNYKKFYTPMTDPTDKRIEELWQYIPPYTAPNHPPQVEVITTTNTGDTPMTEEDPDLLAGDNLDRLRGRNLTEELENARYQNNLLTEECRELEKERDEARRSYCYATGNGEEQRAINIAQSKGWDCFKET